MAIAEVSISRSQTAERTPDKRTVRLLAEQTRIGEFAASIENSELFRRKAFNLLGAPDIYAIEIWDSRITGALTINKRLMQHRRVTAESRERYRRVLEDLNKIQDLFEQEQIRQSMTSEIVDLEPDLPSRINPVVTR